MWVKVKWTGYPSPDGVRWQFALAAGFGHDHGGKSLVPAQEGGMNTLTFGQRDTPEGIEHALDRAQRIQAELRSKYNVESVVELDGKSLPSYFVESHANLCTLRTTVREVVSDLRATRGIPFLRDPRIGAIRRKLEKAL